MKNPKISVLMPVYNGEKYLKYAIDSILNQDFFDFEFIILNDGSTDNSINIINSYSDIRIRFITNEKNMGLVNTLNKGLELALGEYIVRMDCDDVSHKNRLSTQVKFMDKNKNIGASGSYYFLLMNTKKAILDVPLTPNELNCFMLFNSPIAHPTAIIRTSLIRKEKILYRNDFIHAEDYDFWAQIAGHADLANVPDVLLTYRMHSTQISSNKNFIADKNKSLDAIRSRFLKKLNCQPSPEELQLHHLISDGRKPENKEQLEKSEQWLQKLLLQNKNINLLVEKYLEKIILERWLRLCFNYFGGTKGFFYFLNSTLFSLIRLPLIQKLELIQNLYKSFKRKAIKNY